MAASIAKRLWAPIVVSPRGKEWIIVSCVRHTKRGARSAFLEGVDAKFHETMLHRIRFGRVSVLEEIG